MTWSYILIASGIYTLFDEYQKFRKIVGRMTNVQKVVRTLAA